MLRYFVLAALAILALRLESRASDGLPLRPPSAACRTACDCSSGLGCFSGQCIAGIAPVFCCDEPACPAGEQCQHRDGRADRCAPACVDQAWQCGTPGGIDPLCGDDRACECTASCPSCEDCGPGVCVPRGAPTPYRCSEDGSCAQSSDRCLCVASCPDCDDCAASVCVPACKSSCDLRREAVQGRLLAAVNASRRCTVDADCMKISTSTGCASSCLHSINRRYRKRLQRLQHTLDDRVCADYESDGCKRVTTHCPGPPHRREPLCVEGMCR